VRGRRIDVQNEAKSCIIGVNLASRPQAALLIGFFVVPRIGSNIRPTILSRWRSENNRGNQLPIVVPPTLIGVAPVVFAYSPHSDGASFEMRCVMLGKILYRSAEIVRAVCALHLDGEFW
jgi:hypothetical protein